MASHRTLIAVFAERTPAEQAIEELRHAGFRNDQIGMVGPDGKRKGNVRGKSKKAAGTNAGEGAATGAAVGAGVGGLVGLGVLAGVIPVIGPAIAIGTLGTILLNAAGGAAIATVAGALVGMGIPEDEAAYYESELKAGRYVVTVNAKQRSDEALAILRRHGGYDRTTAEAATGKPRGRTSRPRTNQATAQSEAKKDRTLELHEEQLRTRKMPVKKGEVKVRKEVVTEQQTLNVPVSRDEVVVERRRLGTGKGNASTLREGEELRIPITEEQVRLEKETVVAEEVKVGKKQVTDMKQVSATVRKERAHVESIGDVAVEDRTGDPSPRRGRRK